MLHCVVSLGFSGTDVAFTDPRNGNCARSGRDEKSGDGVREKAENAL
jgi:hypothetical protein